MYGFYWATLYIAYSKFSIISCEISLILTDQMEIRLIESSLINGLYI